MLRDFTRYLFLTAFVLAPFSGYASGERKTQEVVLSGISSLSMSVYARMREIAHPQITQLPLTQSEAWLIDSGSVDTVLRLASDAQIKATVIGRDSDRMLKPYSRPPSLSADQQKLVTTTLKSTMVIGTTLFALPDGPILEYELIKETGSGEKLALTMSTPLKDRLSVTARRLSVTRTDGGYAWHGAIIDTGEPVTLLWDPKSGIAGTIRYEGHVYEVKPMDSVMHGIVEFDPAKLPSDHPFVGLHRKQTMDLDPWAHLRDAHPDGYAPTPRVSRPSSGLHDPSDVTITLIVAYTRNAAKHYRDIRRDLLDVAVEDLNESFRNSGIPNVRVRIVHSYETDYVENGSHFDHLFAFVYDHDGKMDEIHELRRRYKANIAVLIVDDPHGCGLSAQVSATADRAFSVVDQNCAASKYSMAHEIGHLLGARHEPDIDASLAPFPFGHGFVNSRKVWRDIMSYEESCGGCPRLPIWSNPDVLINGVPAGDALRNNSEVIRQRASIVAKFSAE